MEGLDRRPGKEPHPQNPARLGPERLARFSQTLAKTISDVRIGLVVIGSTALVLTAIATCTDLADYYLSPVPPVTSGVFGLETGDRTTPTAIATATLTATPTATLTPLPTPIS